MKIKLKTRDNPFLDIVFLDGLSRAGKFLLGKVVSNFTNIEYFTYSEVIEQIPILNSLNMIDEQAASAYLQLVVDTSIYNKALGRNLNMRKNDASYIGNSSEFRDYINRMEKNTGIDAVIDLQQEQRISSFLTHECLPHIEFLFKTFTNVRMINMQRHPVDVIFSWYMNGWGERFGEDPLALMPIINIGEGNIPWFAKTWGEDYLKMNAMDRSIKSIMSLSEMEKNAYNSVNDEDRNNILLISYEKFFLDSLSGIDDISNFLKLDPLPNMEDILLREGCFQVIDIDGRKSKFYKIKEQSKSPDLVEHLGILSKSYEEHWGLTSFM